MKTNSLENSFFILVLAISVFLFVLILRPFLTVIVLAASLAIVFQHLYNRLHKYMQNDFLASLSVVAIVILIVFIPFTFFGIQLFGEAAGQYSTIISNGGYDFGSIINNYFQTNFSELHTPQISLTVSDSARQVLTWVMSNFGSLSSGIGQLLFTAFLSLLGLFYLLKDGEKFKTTLYNLVPLQKEYMEEIVKETVAVMSSVIKGTLVVAVLQGFFAGIGFVIVGIPNPIFWGALVMLCSPIPIVGAWVVILPAIAYLFLTGQTLLCVELLIWSLIVVNIFYNIVAPRLMHRGNNIHPYLILLGMLGGITVFGPIGFLVGPLIVALLFSLIHIYQKMMLVQKS